MFKDLNMAVRALTMYYGQSVAITAAPTDACIVVNVILFADTPDGVVQVGVSTPLLKEEDTERDVGKWVEAISIELDVEIERVMKPKPLH